MSDSRRITEADVRHVAKLSRLRVSDREVEQFTEQLSHVLDYVAKINELDLEGVEPMAHAMDMANVLREDVERAGMTPEKALENAPEQWPPFFKVPKVLGETPGA